MRIRAMAAAGDNRSGSSPSWRGKVTAREVTGLLILSEEPKGPMPPVLTKSNSRR